MGILSWIVVGIIAGWLAERFTGRDHGLLTNLVVGVVGANVGCLIFCSIAGFSYARGVNIATIIVATIGAVLFLWALDWLRFRDRDRLPDLRR